MLYLPFTAPVRRKRNTAQPSVRYLDGLVDLFPLRRGLATSKSLLSGNDTTAINGVWQGDGYFLRAVGERVSFGNGYWNSVIGGASSATYCLEFEWNSISGASTANNIITSFYVASNNGLLVYGNTDGTLNVNARSVTGDSLQGGSSTEVMEVGKRYYLVLVVDYANDTIIAYMNGREWANISVAFGNTTYTAGSVSQADCLGRTTSWYADAGFYGVAVFDKGLDPATAKKLSRNFNALYAETSYTLPIATSSGLDVGVTSVALTLTPQAVGVGKNYNVGVGVVALSLAEQPATIGLDLDVGVGLAALSLIEQPVTVSTELSTYEVPVGVVALTLTPQTLEIGLQAGILSMLLQGQVKPWLLDERSGGALTQAPSLALIYDKVSSTVAYIGKAAPGSVTSAGVWQVRRLTTSAGVVNEWANGDSGYTNIWDNRASLSYS